MKILACYKRCGVRARFLKRLFNHSDEQEKVENFIGSCSIFCSSGARKICDFWKRKNHDIRDGSHVYGSHCSTNILTSHHDRFKWNFLTSKLSRRNFPRLIMNSKKTHKACKLIFLRNHLSPSSWLNLNERKVPESFIYLWGTKLN